MRSILLLRFSLAVAGIVLLSVAASAATFARRFPELYQVTPGPQGTDILVAGDVNGDGKMDLLSGTRISGSYFLSLGHGDGTFAPPIAVTLEANVNQLVLADVDGDGRADAVVTNYSQNSVREYPGLSGGGFGAARLLLTLSRPTALAVADLNGDGRQDLVVTTYQDAHLRTFLQAPDGSFTAYLDQQALAAPQELVLADMDGDHHLDAVLRAGSSIPDQVGIYRGAADGSFSPLNLVTVTGTGMSIGDFNGDGVEDLAVWGYTNDPLVVFLGKGGGALGPPAHFLGSAYASVGGAAVGDWTGDGIDDLILSLNGSSPNPTGLTLFPGSASGITGSNQPVAAPIDVQNVIAADFNGDSHPDVAGVSAGGISVTTGRATGLGVYQVHLPGKPTDLALGDVLGNGRTDLAVQIAVGAGTTYRLYRSFSDQTVQQSAEVSRTTIGSSIALGDMNADGRADLVGLLQNPGTITTYFAGADGSLSAPSNLALSGPSPAAIGIGQLDPSSSTPDVAFVQPAYDGVEGFIGGLMNEGDGTFVTGAVTNSPTSPTRLALGHIDLTKPYLDALVVDAGGNLVLHRGTGGPRFESPVPLGYPGNASGVALGDVNGDGKLDALTWPVSGNAVSVFLGNGDGTFAAAQNVPTVAGISGVAVGDVDGNGTLDIVATHGSHNSVSIFYGNGDGSFGGEDEYFVDPNTALPRVGDIDGDGRADIVLASSSNNLLDVLFQRASAVAVGPKPPSRSLGLQLASANPARGSMTFRMSLPRGDGARLGIFDLHGRLVREFSGLRDAAVPWDGRSASGARVPAGMYFARLTLDRNIATAKFVLMN